MSSELEKAFKSLKKSEELRKKYKIQEIKQLQKDFNKTVSNAKRDIEDQELHNEIAKPSKRTRSGLMRGAKRHRDEYTQGKYITIGMDAVSVEFANDEIDYLKKDIKKVKQVKDLKFDHLKYLISHVFLEELKGIKKGEISSEFHDRYTELVGKNMNDLMSEIRMTLFTNEQRDYLNGYLQEQFEANKKDNKGHIKHDEIDYVETVMLYEATWRIVKFVHKFDSYKETLRFMRQKSREAYGISSDEESP